MKNIILLTILILTIHCLLINNSNALSLKKRIGTTGDNWQTVSTSNDGKVLSYSVSFTAKDFFQYRIDRDNDEIIYNDLYINVTSTNKNIYVNRYFSMEMVADKKASPLSSYLPIWTASCGVNLNWLSLSLNNTIVNPYIKNPTTVPITITVTVRDVMTLCKFNTN